ncbi:MAG: xanthine dehydrogenase family protein subunit M [Deltaproteobacteria bacterium]|nr:xanthine dehydrogenase family protein subunit M [Deltaproteobacteria bacterium]
MRGLVPNYHMTTPATLAEALGTLASEPGWTPFAGGTDLMVVMEAGRLPADVKYLSLHRLDELRGIEVDDASIRFGALVTYRDVREHPIVRTELPMLAQAAKESGAIAIQNRGTLGGNIVNASPAADSPPALLAYGATLELASAAGSRRVAYEDFHQGYKVMDRRPDELLVAIHVPRRPRQHHVYEKVGTRSYQAISKICLAATASVIDKKLVDVRIGLGAVAPTVVLAKATMAVLEGASIEAPGLAARACEAMGRDVRPIDDIRSTADYRRRVAQNLAADLVVRLGGA